MPTFFMWAGQLFWMMWWFCTGKPQGQDKPMPGQQMPMTSFGG